MCAGGSRLGSARVSRVGDGVTPSRTFLEAQPRDGAQYSRRRLPRFESSFRRDAETSTRDACATHRRQS